jgi:hypothetical protein
MSQLHDIAGKSAPFFVHDFYDTVSCEVWIKDR